MTRTAAMSMAFSAPDALLIVLTSLDRYSPRSGTRFAAWVTTIAVNTAHRRFRRRRPELTPTGEVPELPAADVDPGDAIDSARRRAALLRAVPELEPREREIVSLRYGAEQNAAEIAAQLRMQPANLRKILERVRVRLGARESKHESPSGSRRTKRRWSASSSGCSRSTRSRVSGSPPQAPCRSSR